MAKEAIRLQAGNWTISFFKPPSKWGAFEARIYLFATAMGFRLIRGTPPNYKQIVRALAKGTRA